MPTRDRNAELRRNALVDAVPLVEALHALEHHHRDLERDRDHAAVERLALDEAELAGAPGEHVEDAFLGLEHEQVLEVLLRDPAGRHQDLPQQHAGRLLLGDGLDQLLLGDVAVAHQEMAELLLGVGGPGGDDAAVHEEDPLLDLVAADDQRPGLARLGDPLQELGELHRLQVA